jgi:hypothetical protein
MATRIFTLAGVVKEIQHGWTADLTANGRNTLTATILSADGSYRPPIDTEVILTEGVNIVSWTGTNPAVLTTAEAHGFVSGQTGTIAGTPINGDHIVTVLSSTTLSVPVSGGAGGTGGTISRRVIAGNIADPVETGVEALGTPSIRTEMGINDFNVFAERRSANITLPAGTLKSMLTLLVAYLAPYGVTLHPSQVNGPSLDEQVYHNMLLRDVFGDLSTRSSGYIWNIDEYKYLRMFIPSTQPAPFDIVDGGGLTVGDVTVKKTRVNYTNRVVVLFSNEAVQAHAWIIATANFAPGDTVTLGSKTVTFNAGGTNPVVGATISDSMDSLRGSFDFNPDAVGYVDYFFGLPDKSLRMTAIALGAAGNTVAVAETSATAYWRDDIGPGCTALGGGADQGLTNSVVVEDIAAQAAPTYIWETTLEAPEILHLTAATTYGAAYLAAHLLVPRTVVYATRHIGACPGQLQTLTIARRNLTGSWLITDVSLAHEEGSYVLYTVTVLESSLLEAADRWRDLYKLWSGGAGSTTIGVSGSAAPASSLTTVLDDVTLAATVYPGWFTAVSGSLPVYTSSTKLRFNPSTGRLTPTSIAGDGSALTGLAFSQISGTLQAAQEPAHTGDVTNSAGSLALAVGANKITAGMLAQVATRTVLGRSAASTGDVSALTALPVMDGSALTAVVAASLADATGSVNVIAAAAPVAGQSLTATDATHATWQTPASDPASVALRVLVGF